ncbi:MAG: phage holin family protein [Acidobacteriia bacterium]|nr:phage holin family protein [Terriglobia bacterium]
MLRLLLNWILSALALIIVAHVVPGFYMRGFGTALWAAVVIGLINATLGALLKLITLPLTLLTLGIFWLVINALMLWIATAFVPGFQISGFVAAFVGAIVLMLVNMLFRALLPKRERD